MKLKPREMILALAYAAVIIAGGLYYFFYQFGIAQLQKNNEKIRTLREVKSKLQTVIDTGDKVESAYQSIAAKASGEVQSTDILQDIKQQATEAGLHVINLKPFELQQEGLFTELNFKLETEGQMSNLGTFLYNLDKSAYNFTVKFTQINAQGEGEPLKMQMMLHALVLKH